MELKDDTTAATHKRLELIANKIDVKLGDVEFLVPILVELLRLNQIGQLHILESLDLICFWQLVLKKGAKRGLTNAWCAGYQNVWELFLCCGCSGGVHLKY